MEHKSISFKSDNNGENTGRNISGYGSVSGNVDSGGDVVMPGAFSESLKSGRKVKMLWNHNSDEPCGVWADIVEDERGLKVSGIISETARGKDVIALLKDGAIDSLSIGYRTVDAEWKGDTRQIHKAELWEISIVTFPMNELAKIDSIKASEMTKRDLEKKLRDSGFSRNDAQKLISGGYNALSEQRDADEAKSEILALLNKRAELLKSR
ncbi:HK97 family phage prohead protease [Paracoccus sulfuroxidans]|uniref:Prohead serine protease domain-containing protein n=1 Tax=Paracoccus sulfuroxidans TaxID=384678 RepID=A0A562P1C0_9RHOB|nr:HK97 family phage prohead protease [Paracoccus sulfuroxidans]TWI38234.1 hypothetical protein IQ24_00372 [Paracoccus sulfuroxidans]